MMSKKDFFLQRYEKLGWRFSRPNLKTAIRINWKNISSKALIERLTARGIELEKIPFLKDGYWVKDAKFSVGATAEYLLGLYSVQEAAAQLPVLLFDELKKKVVLDACAAPGGKTVQLADLMENSGVIIALDIRKSRLVALANHLDRCSVSNAIAYLRDARNASNLGIGFDRILLDVPCSGNFATDPLWFKRRTISDVLRNASVQRSILKEAAKTVKKDGEIIYSTCSLEPEENEINIDWAIKNLDLQVEKINCYGEESPTKVLNKKLDSSVADCRRIWPSETQGFFVCKLRKMREHA